MGDVFLLSLTAALNPTLLTATTVMLLLPHPNRLMLGYWLGAMMTSITLGLIIVFSLEGSSAVDTTKHTLSPLADIALGVIFLLAALVLGTGRDKPRAARRAERKADKDPPRWQRAMSGGRARTTFVIGALLTLPGASYLIGLDHISKLNDSTAETVVLVLAFNLVMLILLEAPLMAFAVAPTKTPLAIDRAKRWAGTHGRTVAVSGLAILGTALLVKGVIGLVNG